MTIYIEHKIMNGGGGVNLWKEMFDQTPVGDDHDSTNAEEGAVEYSTQLFCISA